MRPDAGAFQPVDGDVAISFNELRKLLGGSRRARGQHAKVGQAPQQDGQEGLDMIVGVPGAEAEVEAQHVEGGVCLEVIQDEEKLLAKRVEAAFRPTRRNLFDFPPLEPFQLDGIVGDREGRGEYVELWTAHADEGFDDAVMFLGIQFCESFVGHWFDYFVTVRMSYCIMISGAEEALGTSLLRELPVALK